jgi:vibriolysin
MLLLRPNRIARFTSPLSLGAAVVATSVLACAPPVAEPSSSNDDIKSALNALPEATVIHAAPDGMPRYVVGDLGRVGAMQETNLIAADAALRPSLAPVLAAFRLHPADLQVRSMSVDEDGMRHVRYKQTFDGLEVVGGDLVAHVDIKGTIAGINGTARGDISPTLGQSQISTDQAVAAITADGRYAGMNASAMREVYLQDLSGGMHKAYEAVVEGHRGLDPVRDKVYVDVDSRQIVEVHPQIYFAENRKVYTANGGSTTPGTLVRSEGQPASSDVDVNGAYDGTGDAYEAYKNFWGRDSYNNAGATLTSTVHYSVNYCNAFWSDQLQQMVYGDGNSSQGCSPLARSVDVTAHELTHAVTANESGLVYSGESGGMNEAMSDIFGAFVEAWTDGGKTGTLAVSANTWLVGEKVIAPALRWMCDPQQDGQSADHWTSSVGNLDVHYSSGVGNLAFCLLSQGGKHPRGLNSTVNVPGIGMDKAIRIFYKANVDILTSSSNYAAFRTATETAATQLGYDQATKDSVSCAWAAVSVGTAPSACGGGGGGGGGGSDGTLTNGTAVTGIAGAAGSDQFWKLDVPAGQTSLVFTTSGGTGDADLYVALGAKPDTSATWKSEGGTTAETVTISNPTAGTYWVLVHGYTSYSGVSLKGTYSGGGGGGGGDPYLTNGTPVTNISGATSSAQYWRITTPAGKTLKVTLAGATGATGDADLYVRLNNRPSTTTYKCASEGSSVNETCTITNTSAGDYYILVYGYRAFTKVTLTGSF